MTNEPTRKLEPRAPAPIGTAAESGGTEHADWEPALGVASGAAPEADAAPVPAHEDEAITEVYAVEEIEPRPRNVIELSRPLFLSLAMAAVVAILALGAVAAWLILDRRDARDPVIATVNGEQIHRSEYDRAVAAGNGSEVLDALVTERLITSEAKRRNVTPDEAEVAKLLDEQKTQFGSAAEFTAALGRAGLSEDDFMKRLRQFALLRRMIADRTAVSDQEVNAFYTANAERFAGQPEATAKVQARATLVSQKEGGAVTDFIEEIRAAAKIETKLPGKAS